MFKEEKAEALEFIKLYNDDEILKNTIIELKEGDYSHSERWSIFYDMIIENFPNEWRRVATGLTYLVEDNNIDFLFSLF